jgi:beta-glucosidase
VVQVYVRDDVASVEEPVRSLKAFRRVTLAPGEMRSVAFKLGPDSFALYDQQLRRVVEPGTFTVFAGTDSNAALSARFEFVGDTLVLAPPTPRFR